MAGSKGRKEPKSRKTDVFEKARAVAVLDGEVLSVLRGLERPGDSVSFLNDVIDTFVQETPEILDSLINAIRSDNHSSILHFSHQLKGLSGNIGVTRMSAICETIEEQAELISKHAPEQICSLLSQAYIEAIRELEHNWKR